MEMSITIPAKPFRLLRALSDLTHDLQIERGYTALFVDSEGEIFGDELRAQYDKTDSSIAKLIKCVDLIQEHSDIWSDKLYGINKNKAKLIKHRQWIQSNPDDFASAVNPYTYSFIYPTIDVNIDIALAIPNIDPVSVSAYSNFLQWKERMGRERAWGAHGFCSKVFKNREFAQRMIDLIEEQSAYKRAFMALATEQQRREVQTKLGGYVMECLENIHKQLRKSENIEELESLSPVTWFELLTGKIDRMYSAEVSLIENLDPSGATAIEISDIMKVPTRLEQHMALIKALPVFSKLGDEQLNTLLEHADIVNCEKGKLLFMQGETLSRFYLILSGWVKLYKSTEAGDEAVLQMLSSGDSLMEAAVFLNIPSLVSAQIVQPTKLLSIPAPIIRQSMNDNPKLAINMV
ncbi:MAG TPA: cyclic nucleotide-binding domain-containing protein, partial [Gammaproteobacteria bacterium]|nr:cyclic nucleotide-binding domain-containing protein [Gammaproteobacteria bacterium]